MQHNLVDRIACVVTFKESTVAKEWHSNIVELCQNHNIISFNWTDVKNDIEALICKSNATGAIAISWKYMLPLSMNKLMKVNLIVFHDSLLPKYRGFAPTPTAMINGENIIGVTALFAGDEADNGDILLQREMQINSNEYMKSIIGRQSEVYAKMVFELLNKVENGQLSSYAQDSSKATYSIWRSEEDYHIDWNWSSLKIFNSIRALGEPYQGAFTIIDDEKVIIDKAEIIDDLNFEIRQPGKIWSIYDNKPKVVCGSGMLKIISARISDNSEYKFNKIRLRLK